ncbi:Penicillinase repressor [Phycisphaerae bacterium RAS1]|nr:Penicillinase repressor [Phycisphaerae bacterium RAS1]
MPKPAPHITEAELRIMKVLWRLGESNVRDVKDALVEPGEEPPAYTTVMTMMNQLAAKGALGVDKSRQPFLYRPAVRREQILGQRLKQFLNSVFDGQAGELVLRLVEEASISPEDLKRIEARIDAIEKAVPAEADASPAAPPPTRAARNSKEGGR